MGRLATDIGGTFTDLVYFDDATGELAVAKSLTTPQQLTDGVMNAVVQAGLSPAEVNYFLHGGTTVINAITERKGVKTALITTAGFRDILEIARGNRPDLYNLKFEKESPFIPRALRFEVRERLGADGSIITPVHLEDVDPIAERLKAERVEAVAILFLHSYQRPDHEVAVAEKLAGLVPGIEITTSSAITREWREYERTSTAVLNAYVQPIVRRYFDRLSDDLAAVGFQCPRFAMQSNGGTASFDWAKQHPITLIESGPAAGVNGAVLVSKLCEEPNVIYLDIGGTTAKCSVIRDHLAAMTTEYKLEATRTQFGYPVRTPVVDIVEIGTGGGSIAWFNAAGTLQVGPQSAGGHPGPACYGLGGTEPTITDAKVVTGIINPGNFAVGKFTLDKAKSIEAIRPIAERLNCSVDEAAIAIIRLGDANMVNALKLVSIQRGHDPREFSMVVGGGGGAMHGAILAREIGVKETIVPIYPGLFSAWGMLATDQRRDFVRSQLSLASATSMDMLRETFRSLRDEAVHYFATDQGVSLEDINISTSCDLRYLGQEHSVTVDVHTDSMSLDKLLDDFHVLHEKAFTFRLSDTPIEVVTYRLKAEARVPRPKIRELSAEGLSAEKARRPGRTVNFGDAGLYEAKIYERSLLPPGFSDEGPIVIEEATSTTIVLPGQVVSVDRFGFLHISESDKS